MMELEEKYDGTRGKIWWNQRKNMMEPEEKYDGTREKYDQFIEKI